MSRIMTNLENVLKSAEAEKNSGQELKTLMNTYRTLLNLLMESDGVSGCYKELNDHLERLGRLLSKVEDEIDSHLETRDFKFSNDYADVAFRIHRASDDISRTLNRISKELREFTNSLNKYGLPKK